MITRIDHIGLAVESLEARLPFWAEALGLPVATIETVDSEKVKAALLPVGASRVELLEATEPQSTIARFLERRGPGMHHLTLAVNDLDVALQRLRSHGVRILGDGARPGAERRRVAFLDPKSTGGVLIELAEDAGRSGQVGIDPGSAVLLYLREPQEKLWGVLRRLDPAGVMAEGIDLSSFDDWMAQVERGEESVVGPSLLFVPMGRVEKILLDKSSGHLPSLAERFQRRIGRSVQDVLDRGR